MITSLRRKFCVHFQIFGSTRVAFELEVDETTISPLLSSPGVKHDQKVACGKCAVEIILIDIDSFQVVENAHQPVSASGGFEPLGVKFDAGLCYLTNALPTAMFTHLQPPLIGINVNKAIGKVTAYEKVIGHPKDVNLNPERIATFV